MYQVRPKPHFSECLFYHTTDLPSHGTVPGIWDLRNTFVDYIGGVNVAGKNLLDIGTASGFLAFEAEKHGATVTAIDTPSLAEQERVPYADSLYHTDYARWVVQNNDMQIRLQNSFWYTHYEYNSKVKVVYDILKNVPFLFDPFDVVVAGAVLEHLADPVSAIGYMCRVTRETLVLAFTPVWDTDDEAMKTLIPWESKDVNYVWYYLSRKLYNRIFDNLGFEVTYVPVSAIRVTETESYPVPRETIIARRKSSL